MRKILLITLALFVTSMAFAEQFSPEKLVSLRKLVEKSYAKTGRQLSVELTLLDTIGEYGFIKIVTKENGNQLGEQMIFTDGKYLFPDVIDVEDTTGKRDELTFKHTTGENIDYSFLSLVYGNKNAKNVIIEVSDFQCPYCRNAHKYLESKYKGKDVAVYLMHYPLSFHLKARLYAKVFEAGKEQDVNFAEELYSTTEDFDQKADSEIINHFSAKVPNKAKFVKDMESTKIDARIDAQFRYAQSYKITGTPHIFFNGKAVSGFRPNLYDIAIKGM